MKVKIILAGIALLVLVCIAGSLAVIPVPIQGNAPAGSAYQPSGPGSGQPGVPPPRRGNCANVNKKFPDNPFEGWPLKFYTGDWRTMSAWFCDPRYLIDMGADHWGVDLASLVETATTPEGVFTLLYTSAHGAEVIATVKEGKYGWVKSARQGGYNFGMGSHVKIMALDCEETCGTLPDSSELEAGEHVWLLKEGAARCNEPGEGETETAPDDLLLACTELGWVATYMHLEEVYVEAGDLVEWGDVLGTVDSTGNSTGHHLHYQINAPGVGAVDPAPSMCPDYSPELRMTNRAHRGSCGE